MADVKNVAGYYDLYDSTKGYTELLFRAGKVLQSKEVNEIQSMLKNQIKNVGNTILTNGDIIEGCQLVIADDKKSLTLTRGRIYLDGDVREVPDTQMTIAGVGTEVIGAIIIQEVVTPDDDADLLDVSTGFDNYNQDGAYRLKETVQITLDNSDAAILYTLTDGEQLAVNLSEDLTQLDKMNATLARRTFDESGNYKVEGLNIVDKAYADDNKIYVSIDAGKAYVKGYEVNKPAATTVGIIRPNTLRTVENEPKIFKTGTNSYRLNNNYPNQITKLMGIVEKEQDITRGSIIGGIDYLPFSPVVSVKRVVQGSTEYLEGTDFQVVNDGIDWSIGTKAPDPGTSYKVTWWYNKTMVKDTDYSLDRQDTIGNITFLASGDKPVNGTTFLINYTYKLCRRDIISIDKDGSVIVTEGQPDILRTVESPSVDAYEVLPLGSILVKPDTDTVEIINNNTKTITMLELYNMLERINELEYNQAITDLDNEAAAGENATQLIGVFTDGFLGFTKSDTYHSEWTASIDLDNQELTLPYYTDVTSLVPNTKENYNAGKFNRLLTAPYTEITLLQQKQATGNIRINSYNAFPKRPSIKLSPEVDNWIDTQTVTIQTTARTAAVTLRRWWYHKNESWAASEKAKWQALGFADGGESLAWGSGTGTVTLTTTSVLDTAILYMRQRRVDVTLQNMGAGVDNIVAEFDGKSIALTPTSNTYKGTMSGSLKADNNGKALGYFTVPANTLCGTRALKVYCANTPSLNNTANYTANGTLRVTTRTVWSQSTNVTPTDPLAQSFQFDMDHFLTGVGIYFLDKDSVNPITVQVRNMVNGYPGNTVYAEKVVLPNAIKISTTAGIETRVTFDDPVYCNANEQYCFTILSNSDIDSIWIAETTKTDITTKSQVVKNPYLNGTLFSSSNALTWTAHQSADMKFNLYGAKFETSGNAVFNVIDDVDFDRLMIMSEESIPAGCSVSWQYQTNDGDWLPIETYDDRDLSEIANKVKIRVAITANTHTSPAIALDSLIFIGFKNELTGTYISKNVHIDDGFNTVKMVVDLNLPGNTSINAYFATDEAGINWQPLQTVGNPVQKSALYKTYTFEKALGAVAKDYRCKLVLTTTDSTSRPTAQNLRNILKTV